MALFVDKRSDTTFDVYNMKRQRIYSGATTTKILSLQVDGDRVIANCEGHHNWLFGPHNPTRPEQSWRVLRSF